ncbi:cellular nucleic acid-binding protein, partial [Trifolium medium]|nr:cellular nucleic acid-binding protein [Trifolium medium]
EEESQLMNTKQVKESLKECAELFVVFASLKLESRVKMEELPVVCEFPDVFPGDLSDVPLERERWSLLLIWYLVLVQYLWHHIGCQHRS